MNLRDRILSGTIWTCLGTIITQGSSFLVMIITVRLLNQVDYGKLTVIQTTIASLSMVAGAGLGITATKFIAEFRSNNKQKLSYILEATYVLANFLSLIFSIILILFAGYISAKCFNDKLLTIHLRIAGFYIFFSTVNGYQVGVLSGFEEFKKISRINICRSIINTITMIFFTYKWGLIGSSTSILVTSIFIYCYSKYLIKKVCNNNDIDIKITLKNIAKEKNILMNFTFPAALTGILMGATLWLSNQILLTKSKNAYESIAVYGVANNLKIIVMFIPSIMLNTITPILVNTKSDDEQKYRKLFVINLIINGLIGFVVSVGIIIILPLICGVVKYNYNEVRKMVLLVNLTTVIEILKLCVYQEIFVRNKIWTNFISNFIFSVVLILATTCLVKSQGAYGMGIAYLIAQSVHFVIYMALFIYYNKVYRE